MINPLSPARLNSGEMTLGPALDSPLLDHERYPLLHCLDELTRTGMTNFSAGGLPSLPVGPC